MARRPEGPKEPRLGFELSGHFARGEPWINREGRRKKHKKHQLVVGERVFLVWPATVRLGETWSLKLIMIYSETLHEPMGNGARSKHSWET